MPEQGMPYFYFVKKYFIKNRKIVDDITKGHDYFVNKYNSIVDKYWKDVDSEFIDGECEWNILSACLEYITIINEDVESDRNIINSFNNIVFEGAQGLMLDMNNKAYWPNLTPSNTGSENIKFIMSLIGWKAKDLEICYVTRSYKTRHGNGFLMHEISKEVLGEKICDTTNITNEHQGTLRFGYLDQSELTLAIVNDMKVIGGHAKHSLAITHLDQTDLMIKVPGGDIKVGQLEVLNRLDGLYISRGNQALNIDKIK